MYYLLNLIFVSFLTIVISLVYTKEAPGNVVLVFLMIAVVSKLLASAYVQSKYFDLKDRINKLENKREDK